MEKKMKKPYQYRVISLDAWKFFDEACEEDTYSIVKKSNGVWGVDFFCDLSETALNSLQGGRSCIKMEARQNDNALFYQLVKVIPGAREDDEYALRESLIFVEFKRLFRSKSMPDSKKCKEQAAGWYGMNKEALQASLPARLRWMLDGGDGIRITFGDQPENKIEKHFVPFDKSGNMSRKSQMCFIDRDLKPSIDLRLQLGLEFSKLSLIPSKYYAYRGLYLSTGFRIQRKGFQLDENSVVVIKDRTVLSENTEFFQSALINAKQMEHTQELTAYDGEGLICPEYAKEINICLRTEYGSKIPDAHTFQIRLPFTKGVLHEVDFQKFFCEYYGLDEKKPLLVEDAFGEKRDLRKAKIILTKSMFKCAGWLLQARKQFSAELKSYHGDFMAFYFAKLDHYNHALYVTGLDSLLSNSGTVRLNYQFLSTLDLTGGELQELFDGNIQKIEGIPDSLSRKKRQMTEEYAEAGAPDTLTDAEFHSTDVMTFAETDRDDEDTEPEPELQIPNDTARSKCLYAISQNSAFLRSTMARGIIKEMVRDEKIGLGKGRLIAKGEQRFFSNDLLGLLEYISELVEDNLSGEIAESFYAKRITLTYQLLRPGRFYMPRKVLQVKLRSAYGFLRSPHLSRNEQCVLVPYINPNSLYEQYFSHLTGVVMVADNSIVPMALSGADFDGDLVKIVSEPIVVEAMKRTHRMEKGLYKRLLPVVSIPSDHGSARENLTGIPFDTVIDTFQNQVGLISNLAVDIARKEYAFKDAGPDTSSANCTVIVGMEIDAAKSGKHPDEGIQAIKDQAGMQKNIFLDLKMKLSDRDIATIICTTQEIVEGQDGSISLYLKKGDSENKNGSGGQEEPPFFQAVPPAEGQPFFALDMLPIRFLSYLKAESQKGPELKKSDDPEEQQPMFRFEQDADWRQALEKNTMERVKLIVQAYRRIQYYAKRLEDARSIAAGESFGGHIVTVLRVKFDEGEKSLYPWNPTPLDTKGLLTAEDLCSRAILTLCKSIPKRSDVKRTLQKMIDSNWQFTAAPSRAGILEEVLLSVGTQVNFDGKFKDLMMDFSNRGYTLFYYVLKEVLRKYETTLALGDFDESERKKQNEELERDPFYQRLAEAFQLCDKKREEKKLIDDALIRVCREELKTLSGIGGNMDTALKYVFSCKSQDNTGSFLWDVFTREELTRNFYIPEESCSAEISPCKEKAGAQNAE